VTSSSEPLGSAAEEAVRLVGAFQEWARRNSAALGDLPLASGSQDCRLCPFCQLIGLLRGSSPEVADHLAQAGESLVAALRAAIAAHERHWGARPDPDVQHIDIG
jgi:hypothetical protein